MNVCGNYYSLVSSATPSLVTQQMKSHYVPTNYMLCRFPYIVRMPSTIKDLIDVSIIFHEVHASASYLTPLW